MNCDSHSGMGDGLTGDVSLYLGLVCPIGNNPAYCSSNSHGPKSVSSQRVYVKAGETG